MPDHMTRSTPESHLGGADPAVTTGSDTAATVATAPSPAAAGRYLLGPEIARGGMGVVHRATDTAFDREVAVKVLLDRYAPTSLTARRFHDEARITGQLQHPGIPPGFDLGTLPDGRPFLAMKLIKGDTLEDLLRARPAREVDRGRFVAAFEQVCQAVAYAHAHGVIHRDLKPQNVMVGAFGEVQVMDWGLAKVLADPKREQPEADPEATTAGPEAKSLRDSEELMTQAGSVLGTPAYIPPEQAIGAVHEVDRRSDVFGLGGILAAVLTGQPPFVGQTAETIRVMSARGELSDCFARLDQCGADPGLVELCKRCLAPRREDRPADAGEVARAVAELRSAADERARRAELDKVKAEGEMAAAEARALERRKRRRVWIGSATALVLAAIGGLTAVLQVQRQANTKLAGKNMALDAEQAKVEQRFEMARKAIAAFHTVVDQEKGLEAQQFKPMRDKLLRSAAGFYKELEGLLTGEADPKSRKALADGYFQLAGLTAKIGNQAEALAVYQKALDLRRELAAERGADADARLALADAARGLATMLMNTGDPVGARRIYEEARDAVASLESEAPSDKARFTLALTHNNIGYLLHRAGKPSEAKAEYEQCRDICQKLADANPTVTEYPTWLGASYSSIGLVLSDMGRHAEGLASLERSRDIRQRLADANPADVQVHHQLAISYINIGYLHSLMGKVADSLAANETARNIWQRLANANPAVTEIQRALSSSQINIGSIFLEMGRPREALAELDRALAIQQKLVDANPSVVQIQRELAASCNMVGAVLRQLDRPADALAAFERARAIQQKLVDANPAVTEIETGLAESHWGIGELLADMGKPAEAMASHKLAQAIQQKQVDASPAIPRFRSDLADSLGRIGRLHARQGQFAEALAALDAEVEICRKLAEADPKSPKYATQLASSYASRGWARTRAGQPKEAAADLRQALELWAKDSAPSPAIRFETARSLALLAKLSGETSSGVTAKDGKVYADRAVSILADTVSAGWTEGHTELKEPDFDAVRGRADFQKIQATLAKQDAAPKR